MNLEDGLSVAQMLEGSKHIKPRCHPGDEVVAALNVPKRSLMLLCPKCAQPIIDLQITGTAKVFQGTEGIPA